jgi:hypothetical protein
MMLSPGTRLGICEVVALLGAGGAGGASLTMRHICHISRE